MIYSAHCTYLFSTSAPCCSAVDIATSQLYLTLRPVGRLHSICIYSPSLLPPSFGVSAPVPLFPVLLPTLLVTAGRQGACISPCILPGEGRDSLRVLHSFWKGWLYQSLLKMLLPVVVVLCNGAGGPSE